MRRRAFTTADIEAIRRGLAAAGLPEDYFGFDDLLFLWTRGTSVEQIVQAAVDRERGRAATTA